MVATAPILRDRSMTHPSDRAHLRLLATFIFGSRWLQVPLYLGLIAAQCVYVVLFIKELWHLMLHATTFTEQQIMLLVLALIDVVMISNLLIMVIVGGYETFISRMNRELIKSLINPPLEVKEGGGA